ncbi:MAG: tetratricopeptide repeat protein [Desulfovibrionaceae bacterium]
MSNHLDYEINKELGECYLFMGDLEKAEEYYTKAANSNGVHPDPYMGLATVAVHKGELEKALEMYQQAFSIEPSDKSLAGMALIESERGEPVKAFELFVAALDKNPENMVALYGMVQIGHQIERLQEVVPRLEDFLKIDPLKHEIRYSLAGSLYCLDRKSEAREHLERILEQDPDNESAQELLAQVG